MVSTVITLQAIMFCTTSICWAQSCSSSGEPGRCSIEQNEANIQNVFAAAVSKITLLFPKVDNSSSHECKCSCWESEVGRNNDTLTVDDKVKKLNELIKKLKNDLKVVPKEDNLTIAVRKFMESRDWPKLKEVLESTLEPDDPALKQARIIFYTDGKNVLMDIVYSGHTELLKKLLDHGLDVNLPWGINNSTMLHAVASTGVIEMAELLFSRGALIDAQADWNVTPLLRAVSSHQPKMVRWLLDHGADINVEDTHGLTALQYADEGDDETINVLVNAGMSKDTLGNRDPLLSQIP